MDEVIAKTPGTAPMTEHMARYCISELQHRAVSSAPGDETFRVYSGDVLKSDSAVPDSLRLRLQKAVRALEDVPEHLKTWNASSGHVVLDLVDPNLYPLVYGKSRILPVGNKRLTLQDCIERCGEGERLPKRSRLEVSEDFEVRETYSDKFQWMPCEVDIVSSRKPRCVGRSVRLNLING